VPHPKLKYVPFSLFLSLPVVRERHMEKGKGILLPPRLDKIMLLILRTGRCRKSDEHKSRNKNHIAEYFLTVGFSLATSL
jgi:hypothetical protein